MALELQTGGIGMQRTANTSIGLFPCKAGRVMRTVFPPRTSRACCIKALYDSNSYTKLFVVAAAGMYYYYRYTAAAYPVSMGRGEQGKKRFGLYVNTYVPVSRHRYCT
jgi:hypothetical protein